MKGVIKNALVQAYLLSTEEDGRIVSKYPFGAPVRTDAEGRYRLHFPVPAGQGLLVIKVSADDETKMTCDVPKGCLIQKGQAPILFGQDFSLDADFELSGSMTELSTEYLNKVNITPLSHLAIARAEGLNGGLTLENIQSSYAYIEQTMGLKTGALQWPLLDLTQLDEIKDITKTELKTAVMSASFLALLYSPDWLSISELMNHAAQKIRAKGAITLTNMGALPELSLDDLYYQAGELTQSLLSSMQNQAHKTSLTEVLNEVAVAYDLAVQVAEVIDPVLITQQPESVDADEGDPVEFQVYALGGGELNYQWRKDGTSISGATQSAYEISHASEVHEGSYDVLVSNDIGSVVSLSALLILSNVSEMVPEDALEEDVVETSEAIEAAAPTGTSEAIEKIEEIAASDAVETALPSEPIETNVFFEANNKPINETPIAVDDVFEIFEDIATRINVLENDTDSSGTRLVISNAQVIEGKGHVSITQLGESGAFGNQALVFTPATNNTEATLIRYTVMNDLGVSATADAWIQVIEINDAPVALNDAITTHEDTAISIDVLANDFDVDGDSLSISSATALNGVVTLKSDNTLSYQPSPDFFGPTTLTYIIMDGRAGISTGSVTVTVQSENDAPIAVDDFAQGYEDTTLTLDILANDSDPDADALIITLLAVSSGYASIQPDNSMHYQPAENFNGDASLSYTVSDQHGASAQAEVKLSIQAVNDAPVAMDDVITTHEDTPVSIDVLANDIDVDGDSLSISSATALNGVVSLKPDNTLSYQPSPDFFGLTTLTYIIMDGRAGISTGSVTVTVQSENDAPIAVNDVAQGYEDTALTLDVVANDSDPDADALIITHLIASSGFATIQPDNTVRYQPAENFNGDASIRYTVSDQRGGSAQAEVKLSIQAVNDAPVAIDDVITTHEDIPVIIHVLENDSDIDSDLLSLDSVSVISGNARVAISESKRITFVPERDFHGLVSIAYTISDEVGKSASALITVRVHPVNDLPTAKNTAAETEQGLEMTLNILANASDIDGDILKIISATVENGEVSFDENGTVIYTPQADFSGLDILSYRISDGQGGQASAELAISVLAVNKRFSLELSWDMPKQRDDESELDVDEINGYILAYGRAPNELNSNVFIDDAYKLSYLITELEAGTYYFTIATLDNNDLLGAYSDQIMISLQ